MMTIIDITGNKYGRLTVIKFSERRKRRTYWLCQCDCGNFLEVRSDDLRSGHTTSCGCFKNENMSKRMSGENHPRWKDGSSKKDYPKTFNKKLKEEIRFRDSYNCQYPNCNYNEISNKLESLNVHHIDGNKNNNNKDNLISLCRKHHMKIESNNPVEWIDYFKQKIKDFSMKL